MATPKPSSPARDIVTWPPGDPGRERDRWGREAFAYCRLKKRPTAAAVVKALVAYLNSESGFAWVSDQTIARDIGARHDSAARRAISQAADELGVITRQTEFVLGKGKVAGRERRIFASRPHDMTEVLTTHRTLNAESTKKNEAHSDASSTFSVQMVGPHSPERRTLNDRTLNAESLNAERLGEDIGLRDSVMKNSSTASVVEGKAVSAFGEAARRFLPRSSVLAEIVEDLSRFPTFDGTRIEDETESLLEVGRRLWRARRSLTPSDVTIAAQHAREAAVRSWLDHRPEVRKMLDALGAKEAA